MLAHRQLPKKPRPERAVLQAVVAAAAGTMIRSSWAHLAGWMLHMLRGIQIALRWLGEEPEPAGAPVLLDRKSGEQRPQS